MLGTKLDAGLVGLTADGIDREQAEVLLVAGAEYTASERASEDHHGVGEPMVAAAVAVDLRGAGELGVHQHRGPLEARVVVAEVREHRADRLEGLDEALRLVGRPLIAVGVVAPAHARGDGSAEVGAEELRRGGGGAPRAIVHRVERADLVHFGGVRVEVEARDDILLLQLEDAVAADAELVFG